VLAAVLCLVAVGVSLLDRLTPDDAGFRTLVRPVAAAAPAGNLGQRCSVRRSGTVTVCS
jgi:hypothetical protein